MLQTVDTPWVLLEIEASGFLGIGTDARQLDLDREVIVLVGPNGSGKSTWLAGVEWVLFGTMNLGPANQVRQLRGAGLAQHRVYLHQGCDVADVRLLFERDGSRLEIRRVRHTSHPKPDDDDFTISVDGEPSSEVIEDLIGVGHDAFTRAIAPRQSTLRALVSDESSERHGALDELLGIAELNRLTGGLSRANRRVSARINDVQDNLDSLLSRLERRVVERYSLRSDARTVALGAGIEPREANLEGARSLATKLATTFGVKYDGDPLKLDDVDDLRPLLESEARNRLTTAGPYDRAQRLRRVAIVRSRWGAWDESGNTTRELTKSHADLEKELGTETDLETERGEFREALDSIDGAVTEANRRLGVLVQAGDWLSDHDQHQPGSVACPVCEREIDFIGLSNGVHAAIETMEASDGEVARLVSTRAGAQTTLDTSKKALRKHVESKRRLEAAETETADRRRELVGALNEVLVHWEGITPDAVEVPVIQAINAAVVLAEQYPTPDPKIKNTDLETLIREILAKLSDATQQTGIEIEQAAETARDDLERSTALGHLVTFLRYSKALDELDGALSGSDLAEARVLVDATSKRLETLHVVADVAEELSGAEATARAAALSPVINQWFERTSLHEQLVRASLNVASSRPGGRITNAYTIRAINDDGTWTASPGPELSGGYEALLAVAVLCALSDPRFQQHSLGLVMLDEPTESLDDVLSRRLGETLGRDAPAPRTIVTTIDRQFAEAVQSAAGVTRAKVVELEEWNLAEGTRFMESTKS